MQSKNLGSYFEVIVGQEDTTQHKPNPAPLLLAADKMNVSHADYIYIGDQSSDIWAAHQAGMASAAALWGEGNKKWIVEANPTVQFEAPREFLQYMMRITENQSIPSKGGFPL